MKTLQIRATEPQLEFLNLDCRYPLFVGGFGSGKTFTLITSAIMDAFEGPEVNIALYAPTYDLVRLILATNLTARLEQYGIDYDYNKAENIITPRHPQLGRFILRSLDNPDRIVGYQSYRSHIDELDTIPTAQAELAWEKIIGRNRQVPNSQTIKTADNRVSAYSTPEGYRFLYDRWDKNNPNPQEYQSVRVTSESNPYLSPAYIQSLRDSYSPELVEAYLEGKFVNLKSGTVYYSYNRHDNNSTEEITEYDSLHIGMDFNVGKQCSTIFVKRGKTWHAVEELVNLLDTPTTIDVIKEKYGNNRNIYIYPDASGQSRRSTGASVSDLSLLRQAGFAVRVNRKNPLVKDRVNATNAALNNKRIFVNYDTCPNVAECLEQQAYDKNGEPDKKSGKDHQNDATTYFIAYQLPIQARLAAPKINFYQ